MVKVKLGRKLKSPKLVAELVAVIRVMVPTPLAYFPDQRKFINKYVICQIGNNIFIYISIYVITFRHSLQIYV